MVSGGGCCWSLGVITLATRAFSQAFLHVWLMLHGAFVLVVSPVWSWLCCLDLARMSLQLGPPSSPGLRRCPGPLEILAVPSTTARVPLSVYCFPFSPEEVPGKQGFLSALFSAEPNRVPDEQSVPSECVLRDWMSKTLPGLPVSPRIKGQIFTTVYTSQEVLPSNFWSSEHTFDMCWQISGLPRFPPRIASGLVTPSRWPQTWSLTKLGASIWSDGHSFRTPALKGKIKTMTNHTQKTHPL